MNSKLLLSSSVAKLVVVLVAVVAIFDILTFTAPHRAFSDNNYDPTVDITENGRGPSPADLSLELVGNAPDRDSEFFYPVDGLVAPENEHDDKPPNNSGAQTFEIPPGEVHPPKAQQRGESRQTRQRGVNTWVNNLENGPLVTMIRQEDRRQESQVSMRHTITKDTVVSGPLEARVEFQYGFDVTGLHGAAELRIYDPYGRDIRTVQGNPNSEGSPVVYNSSGNRWNRLLFRFDGEISVSAGSTFEVDMVFHGRNKPTVRRQNPGFQGPLGPGHLKYNARPQTRFAHRGQRLASCTRSLNSFSRKDGPDPRKLDTLGINYATLPSVAQASASKTSGATRLHQECHLRVL